MSNGYIRKTTNPNMGWSEERKAESSVKRKQAHAENKWHKKSKKEVALAISNGRKEAIKRKNRSEGQKKRHARAEHKVEAPAKEVPLPPNRETWTPKKVKRMNSVIGLLDLIEEHLGVRPDFGEFVDNAVEDKLAKFKKALCKN